MSDIPYDDLDPGIREVVRWLNEAGFPTMDSGDGKAKFDDDGNELPGWEGGTCGYGVPHAIIAVHPHMLVEQADDLVRALRSQVGITVQATSPDGSGVEVQANYDPANGIAVVVLSGLDDDGLARARGAA